MTATRPGVTFNPVARSRSLRACSFESIATDHGRNAIEWQPRQRVTCNSDAIVVSVAACDVRFSFRS